MCVNKKNYSKYDKTNTVLPFTHAMKHTTLTCMHTVIYCGCNQFKVQKTDPSFINKVAHQLNDTQPETNPCHQTVLFSPYLQKRPILSMFLGFSAV